ncbi:MAG: efflux RND transporter periplasmic adaptor subunit [Thermoguttaceae bacterium]
MYKLIIFSAFTLVTAGAVAQNGTGYGLVYQNLKKEVNNKIDTKSVNTTTEYQSSGDTGVDGIFSAEQQTPLLIQRESPFSRSGLSRSEAFSDTIELIRGARVEPEKQVTISSRTLGLLTNFKVPKLDPRTGKPLVDSEGKPIMVEIKAGQMVTAGQLLGTIDSRQEESRLFAAQAELDVANAEAAKTIEVKFAYANLQVAVTEVKRIYEINKTSPGTIPESIVKKTELEANQANASYKKAVYELEEIKPKDVIVKQAGVKLAEVMLEQRQILTPVSGRVEEISGQNGQLYIGTEGQVYREGEPLLRIVRYDIVKVRGMVDGKRVRPQDVYNRKVTVDVPTTKGETLKFDGKVVFASQEFEIDGSFVVHVEVENKQDPENFGFWLINPGSFVDLYIHLDQYAD